MTRELDERIRLMQMLVYCSSALLSTQVVASRVMQGEGDGKVRDG
jgi:hypothetical protein